MRGSSLRTVTDTTSVEPTGLASTFGGSCVEPEIGLHALADALAFEHLDLGLDRPLEVLHVERRVLLEHGRRRAEARRASAPRPRRSDPAAATSPAPRRPPRRTAAITIHFRRTTTLA